MLNGMRNLLRTTRRWLQTALFQVISNQSPSEQRKASWAEAIHSYDDVPDVFKDVFIFDHGREFPYTVLTPSYEGFIHRTSEKLICDFKHEIFVLERNGNTINENCFPLKGISYVEVRTLLLDSSIKICGMTKDGVPASSTFRFNATTDYLFTPILHRMRQAPVESDLSAHYLEIAKFDSWKGPNYKFMNYARHSILVGEKVLHTILQPEIRETVLKVFGKTYRRVISPTLASILTDRELIMIREEKLRSGAGKYGGIWDYIPLKKILTLSLSEKDKDLLTLSVQLADETRLEYLFQSSAEQEINRLQHIFKEQVIA